MDWRFFGWLPIAESVDYTTLLLLIDNQSNTWQGVWFFSLDRSSRNSTLQIAVSVSGLLTLPVLEAPLPLPLPVESWSFPFPKTP